MLNFVLSSVELDACEVSEICYWLKSITCFGLQLHNVTRSPSSATGHSRQVTVEKEYKPFVRKVTGRCLGNR